MMPLALLRKYRCIYLASPYSLHRGGSEMAWAEACKLGGDLVAEGVRVFSAIAQSYSFCEHADLDLLDHELWLEQDEFFMAACDALVVAQFAGWEDSYGIAQQINYFRDNNKPIHYLDPDGTALVAITEIHVNAWHIKKQGKEFIVTIGSSDAKTQRLIIGMNHALDFTNKIEAALNEQPTDE